MSVITCLLATFPRTSNALEALLTPHLGDAGPDGSETIFIWKFPGLFVLSEKTSFYSDSY